MNATLKIVGKFEILHASEKKDTQLIPQSEVESKLDIYSNGKLIIRNNFKLF